MYMLTLKATPIGDIQVQADDEKDARKYLDTLLANGLVSEDENPPERCTHRIVVENGVKTLKRIKFNK
jgi:hypothetical protein